MASSPDGRREDAIKRIVLEAYEDPDIVSRYIHVGLWPAEENLVLDFMGEDEMFPMVFQEHQRRYIEKLRARIMMYKAANRGDPEPLPENPHQGLPWTEEEVDEDAFVL